MKTKKIIKEVESILHHKYNAGSIDSELVEDCIRATIEVINENESNCIKNPIIITEPEKIKKKQYSLKDVYEIINKTGFAELGTIRGDNHNPLFYVSIVIDKAKMKKAKPEVWAGFMTAINQGYFEWEFEYK